MGRAGIGHAFLAEDLDDLNRILGQQYHAVVGNPPYITVKDAPVNRLYRKWYSQTCHMKYALSVAFTERFFELSLHPHPSGSGSDAGYVGMITANSFMKREFGKKLVEAFLPKVDLTHVIETSGEPIPGHGTTTVILFGRARRPVAPVVRTVMAIKGEPAQRLVWSAIVGQVDRVGSESEWVSVADTPRETFGKHPWSIGGGAAADLKEFIDDSASVLLGDIAADIGITAVTGEDALFIIGGLGVHRWIRLEANRALVVGDLVRDWWLESKRAVWLYDDNLRLLSLSSLPKTARYFWPYRASISRRKRFGTPMLERGLAWYEYQELYDAKLRTPPFIAFAFVATHNHFVLDRGGKVFKQSAPVIKLPAGATEAEHLGLLGLLNSSTACFWMKQVFHNKGSTVDTKGARQTTDAFENFYEFTGTGLQKFPIPEEKPLSLATELDRLARERQAHLPAQLVDRFPMTRAEMDIHRGRVSPCFRISECRKVSKKSPMRSWKVGSMWLCHCWSQGRISANPPSRGFKRSASQPSRSTASV
jgi:hypothetical protein